MAIGVFGLQVAYRLKRLEVMSTDDTHGWFGGGYSGGTPGKTATVDRIDFSNDTGTANIRGPLSASKYGLAATGNSNYGWFGGGYSSPPATSYSLVDRIDFSNDSSTASPRGPLSLARRFLAATGNSNYGWFGGGYSPSAPTTKSIVERIDFSNDSATASSRGPLSLARYSLAATGNSNYGWFGGGNPAAKSTVDRIDFSNDSSTASPRGPLSAGRYGLAATGNSNYGWFGGGAPGAVSAVSTVDRIDFSNDSSTASVRGPLSSERGYLSATGNSNYGWFGGSSQPALVATVDRIDFSNDTSTASPRGSLSSERGYLSATSGQAKGPAIKLQKAGNYGWFGGGRGIPSIPILVYPSVDRIDFSNDLNTASPRTGTISSRSSLSATGNSNYGWFGGGNNGIAAGSVATVDRIDFSNDASTALVRGPLSSARYAMAATGNYNYGWFTTGYDTSAANSRTVFRLNFSNDSSTTSPRTIMPIFMAYNAATGNSNYGWFGGGQNGTPLVTNVVVNRIDFSNDSNSPLSRGSLSRATNKNAATGNSNYGWFGGGYSGGFLRTVDRIDFSNDSVNASPRAFLSNFRSGLAATGNSNYGWFGGGYFPASTALVTVDKINFANDTTTATSKGSLNSPTRYFLAATSNTPT
jgi:hypothetical protein